MGRLEIVVKNVNTLAIEDNVEAWLFAFETDMMHTVRVANASLSFFFLMIRRPPRSTPLSLHDALPICVLRQGSFAVAPSTSNPTSRTRHRSLLQDRKSTRLNSSHITISYAVFCLK